MTTPASPSPTPNPGEPTGPSWRERLEHQPAQLALGLGSLLLLALALAAGWYVLGRMSPPARPAITPPASLAELIDEYPQMAGVLSDPKLDSVYKDFLQAYQEGGVDAAYRLAGTRGLLNANGDIRLTLELDTTDTAMLKNDLESFGVQVTAEHGSEIDIAIPRALIDQLADSEDPSALFEQLSSLQRIKRIRLPSPSIQDDEGIGTESVPVIGANAWQQAGITGRGIRVGVLDRGFDAYTRLLGSDLPQQVTARSFISGVDIDQTGSVHGAAVAEIIHDIAPDAELYFAAYDTDVEFRLAVDWLLSQKVRVISHSAGSMYGPMNGTSPDALMVDQIVADGVLWVNSAGNTGYTHYRGVFTDQDGDGFHEFAPNDPLMDFIANGPSVFVLNWDDWGRGLEDFDLYILDAAGTELASSTNIQDGPEDDSAEIIFYNFDDSKVYYLAFYAKRSTRPVVFDFYMREGRIEYYTAEGSITTPGDARRSLTVGATNWSDDVLEDYSAQGPTRDGRLKPDLVAPAGVSSAAYGKTWQGTSASTPHVSGVAALVRQAFPNYSPDQVSEFLEARARDLGPG
ncbi:MAG: S8 family serine peptidase, partial [Chloroflexota bacterium]